MSPGLRLLVSPGVLAAGALLCYALPPRAGRVARLLAGLTIAVAGGLTLSVAGTVFGGGVVERSLGDMVPGVALSARGDPTGMAVALLAGIAAVLALAEGGRLPLERTALLLCLTGSVTAAFAGNAVLLFAGMELGNVGALLMAAASARLGRRARAAFGFEHLAALGLLSAAIELASRTGTTDLAALPAGAVTASVAAPWAVAGVVRLLAVAALPGVAGRAAGPAWASVAAAPTGLVVLLRLREVTAPEGLPRWIAAGLVAVGVAVALLAGADAIRRHSRAAAAGRALSVAAAGPVIALVGVSASTAAVGAAACGVALVAGVAGAAAWGGGGDEGSGVWARRLRALALAAVGGLPLGAGTAAMVLGASAAVTAGLPESAEAVAIVVAALPAAVGGGLAARAALAAPSPAGRWRGPRLDAAAAVVGSAVLALAPGACLGPVAVQLAGGGDTGAGGFDAATVRGPGGGLASGYLAAAALLAVIAAWAAGSLQGAVLLRRPMPSPVPRQPRPLLGPALVARVVRGVGTVSERVAAVDRALVGQPGLVAVVGAAVVCLYVFR